MSNTKAFRCPVCEKVGEWQNVDQYRVKPQGMHICKTCGFITYTSKYKTESEIKEYYRKDYRSIPQAHNVITGTRKLNYHHFFLTPIFDEWRKVGINKPVIGEIGSALGMFIDWARKHFPEAEFVGTELTINYRKIAKQYYNVDLVEDFDYTKKYDLITSYHVLEHQIDPDKKLKEYADCLAPHGFFYLSCPVWFRDLMISAKGSYEIEEYWHPDHINSWDEKHLEHIIAKAGLEVIYKNDEVYGNTYICKKSTKPIESAVPQLYKTNLEFLDKALKVQDLLIEHKTKEALDLHKNCPVVWANHYEFNRQNFDKKPEELKKYLEECVLSCPNSSDAYMFAADVATRYEKYNDALEYLEKALKKRPNSAPVLFNMSNCLRGLGLNEKDQQKKNEYFNKSIEILRFVYSNAPEMHDRCLTWMFHDMAQIN